jgi:hypothetical protein
MFELSAYDYNNILHSFMCMGIDLVVARKLTRVYEIFNLGKVRK